MTQVRVSPSLERRVTVMELLRLWNLLTNQLVFPPVPSSVRIAAAASGEKGFAADLKG
jgi:hypothetical protein